MNHRETILFQTSMKFYINSFQWLNQQAINFHSLIVQCGKISLSLRKQISDTLPGNMLVQNFTLHTESI